MSQACRRCAECEGQEHHWLKNPDFGREDDDDIDRPDATGNEYICKHCPAVGGDCRACEGHGTIQAGEGESADEWDCEHCEGTGIVEREPKQF
jgi:hypothetical protein